MASNPPSECCTHGNFHEGNAKGTHTPIFGVNTYETGKDNGDDKIIVIATDVLGNKFNNVLLIADELAKVGKFKVLIPDILKDDPVKPGEDLQTWLKKHTPEEITPFFHKFLSSVKSELKPKKLYGIGYCFGAKYVVRELNDGGLLDGGALAHPSFIQIDEVKAIRKPVLISAAQEDSIFTTELRHETEKELATLNRSHGVEYQVDLFSGVSHGFSVRGDIKIPSNKYAKEKTLSDQLSFFNQY